eukprot:763196-Hanusia_phi.AAC.1
MISGLGLNSHMKVNAAGEKSNPLDGRDCGASKTVMDGSMNGTPCSFKIKQPGSAHTLCHENARDSQKFPRSTTESCCQSEIQASDQKSAMEGSNLHSFSVDNQQPGASSAESNQSSSVTNHDTDKNAQSSGQNDDDDDDDESAIQEFDQDSITRTGAAGFKCSRGKVPGHLVRKSPRTINGRNGLDLEVRDYASFKNTESKKANCKQNKAEAQNSEESNPAVTDSNREDENSSRIARGTDVGIGGLEGNSAILEDRSKIQSPSMSADSIPTTDDQDVNGAQQNECLTGSSASFSDDTGQKLKDTNSSDDKRRRRSSLEPQVDPLKPRRESLRLKAKFQHTERSPVSSSSINGQRTACAKPKANSRNIAPDRTEPRGAQNQITSEEVHSTDDDSEAPQDTIEWILDCETAERESLVQIFMSVFLYDPTRPLSLKLDDSGLYWANDKNGSSSQDRSWTHLSTGRFENHMRWCNVDKSKMLQACMEGGKLIWRECAENQSFASYDEVSSMIYLFSQTSRCIYRLEKGRLAKRPVSEKDPELSQLLRKRKMMKYLTNLEFVEVECGDWDFYGSPSRSWKSSTKKITLTAAGAPVGSIFEEPVKSKGDNFAPDAAVGNVRERLDSQPDNSPLACDTSEQHEDQNDFIKHGVIKEDLHTSNRSPQELSLSMSTGVCERQLPAYQHVQKESDHECSTAERKVTVSTGDVLSSADTNDRTDTSGQHEMVLEGSKCVLEEPQIIHDRVAIAADPEAERQGGMIRECSHDMHDRTSPHQLISKAANDSKMTNTENMHFQPHKVCTEGDSAAQDSLSDAKADANSAAADDKSEKLLQAGNAVNQTDPEGHAAGLEDQQDEMKATQMQNVAMHESTMLNPGPEGNPTTRVNTSRKGTSGSRPSTGRAGTF